MRCNNCNFDNIGIEFIPYEEIDDEEEFNCEFCGCDLRQQLKDHQHKD